LSALRAAPLSFGGSTFGSLLSALRAAPLSYGGGTYWTSIQCAAGGHPELRGRHVFGSRLSALRAAPLSFGGGAARIGSRLSALRFDLLSKLSGSSQRALRGRGQNCKHGKQHQGKNAGARCRHAPARPDHQGRRFRGHRRRWHADRGQRLLDPRHRPQLADRDHVDLHVHLIQLHLVGTAVFLDRGHLLVGSSRGRLRRIALILR